MTEEHSDTPEEPGEIESLWSNKHWNRLKRSIGANIGLFILVFIGIAIEVPENGESSPADTPVTFSLFVIWLIFSFALPFLLSYFISKDKIELGKYLEGIKQRSTILVFVFNISTLFGYTLWYGYVRWRQLDNKVQKTSVGVQQAKDDEHQLEGGTWKSRLKRFSESLTGENIVTNLFLDESFEHYLENNEEIQYILSHNNNPFRGRYLDGRDRVAKGFNPIGSQYLLVTDRRLLFCTGKIWRDTVHSFDYAEISKVTGNDDYLTSTFEFVDSTGETHLFKTQTTTASNVLHKLETKVGTESFQVTGVTDYVKERVRAISSGTEKASTESVATQQSVANSTETGESTAGGTAKTTTATDRQADEEDTESYSLLDESETSEDEDSNEDRITRYIAEGDEYRETTAARLGEGAYDTAIEEAKQAINAYREARELAAESKEVDIEPIESKLNEVIDLSETIHREKIGQDLENIASELQEVEGYLEGAAIETAQETLENLEARIVSANNTATANGFERLEQRARKLESRRAILYQKATEEQDRDKIPANIPRAPSLTVDYSALTGSEPIGGGGNADVSKAILPRPDSDIELAIKEPRMSGTLHTDTVDRILDEAETWNKLDDHDHIVGVVDYGSTPIPWIAMEYMDSGHLGEKIDQMGIRQSLWTAIAITKGVRHAHRRGVAHLDLKPENVLFRTIPDAWDVPKVGDWGLSKHLLQHSQSIQGYTPTYAAPEQLDSEYGPADDITDVYQLGAVFYELFTGRPPFTGENTGSTIRKVLTESVTPPSEIADIPSDLDTILLKALEKEKADRYESVLLLRNDLQNLFEQ